MLSITMAPHNCQASPPVQPAQCSQISCLAWGAPRHPLPCATQHPTAGQDRISQNTRKTAREKAKGHEINCDGFKGVVAQRPCTRCIITGKKCYVPRNPATERTYKCGNCIGQKVCCDLNINNPGVPYDEDSTEANRKQEVKKAQGRQKAAATRRRRRAEVRAKAKAKAEPKTKEGSA
ncbi:hypothetical protein GGR55DRAFT_638510 [Xylaria sp. FL0064]|nr:hypothetical protein GGR55DRAFT_638510 [Xylaria sp. FL0064]